MKNLTGQMGLAIAAGILTLLGWFWGILCFTAVEDAWWNSHALFTAVFGLALGMAMVSFFVQSSLASKLIAGLIGIWASLSLTLVLGSLIHQWRLHGVL